jgi:hypothetical protein
MRMFTARRLHAFWSALTKTQKTYLFAITVLSLSGALAVAAASALAAPGAPAINMIGSQAQAQAASAKSLQDALRGAVIDSQAKLGTLEVWQKKIFDEEVVPLYQRFIRDYRAANGGYTVEVDLEAMRRYLAFYSMPKGVRSAEFRIASFVRADPSCAKCVAAVGELKEMFRLRLERRGFAPVWMSQEEIGESSVAGKELDERIVELAAKRNIPAAAVLQWRQAPIDAIDTAHADEKRYQLRAYIIAREPVENSNRQIKHEGTLEVLENDTLDSAASQLLTDTLTDLGSKSLAAQLRMAEGQNDEIQLVINGVGDFTHFNKIKAQLMSQLRDATSIEERRIARGQVTFAIRSTRAPREIRRSLAGMAVDPGRLTVHESGAPVSPATKAISSGTAPSDPDRLIEAEIR